MWVRRVVARAFGPLHQRELVLRPGLNIVHGPNVINDAAQDAPFDWKVDLKILHTKQRLRAFVHGGRVVGMVAFFPGVAHRREFIFRM